MYEVLKWLRISSFQLDQLRLSWVENIKAEAKVPREFAWITDKKTKETRDWLKATDILWGQLHFLYIALNQLLKALDRHSDELPEVGVSADLKIDIKLLRDIHEHWGEEDIRSLKKFQERYKNVNPRTINLIPFEKFEAGGLDLNRVQSVILKLENMLDL